jgi:hypothetical protein
MRLLLSTDGMSHLPSQSLLAVRNGVVVLHSQAQWHLVDHQLLLLCKQGS